MAVDKNGKKLPKGIIQREDGRYMGRFMYKGETYTLYEKNSVKRLQKAMNDLKYELEHGLYANASKVSVGKWFNTWMEEYKLNTVKMSTYKLYETYYNTYIKKSLEKKQIKDLRPIHIQKLYNDMAKKGMKTNTIKKVDTILRGMLRQAVKNEILLRNPCDSVEIPKTETKERRVLSLEEQQEFMQYVRMHTKWKNMIHYLRLHLLLDYE